MARRQRKYHAKSNKGKRNEVFAHNVIADLEKRAREFKKEAQEREKRRNKQEAQRVRDVKKRRDQLARESQKQKKQQEKLVKTQRANEERFQKFILKAELQCAKYGVDPVCAKSIAKEAFEKGVSLNQIGTLVIKDKENEWNLLAPKIHQNIYCDRVRKVIRNLVDDNLLHNYYIPELFSVIVDRHIELPQIKDSKILISYIEKSKKRFKYEANIKILCDKAVEKGLVLERLSNAFLECFKKSEEIKLSDFSDSQCYRLYKKVSIEKVTEVEEKLSAYLRS